MTGLLGGAFGLDLPAPAAGGIAALWQVTDSPFGWANATSALAALVAVLRPATVWLPGYLCTDLLAAVPPPARRFFPLTATLEPDCAALERHLRPGDMVLAVNMFGKPPGAAWRGFVAAHPGVSFVEDCAQTLDSGAAPWGDWLLWSPRKLLGVPDGGVLRPVSARAAAQAADLPPPGPADPTLALASAAPALARLEAPLQPALWHPLYRAAEAALTVSDRPMSRLGRALLALHDPAPMIAARRRNFRHLAERLAPHAVLPDTDPGFAPLGFPVTLPPENRQILLDRLYARGIFPAVHWREIAAPPGFAADHARAASLVTLPCDHRYDLDDMERLAVAFLEDCP